MAINVVPTDAMRHITTGATCPCEPRDQLIQRDGEPDLWLVLHKYMGREARDERPRQRDS